MYLLMGRLARSLDAECGVNFYCFGATGNCCFSMKPSARRIEAQLR